MTRDLRANVSRRLVALTAGFVILVFLAPLRAAAQESGSPDRQEEPNLETSVRRPSQQRLEAAFPDSFREGVDIFWEPPDGWVSPEVFGWWVSRVEPKGLTREAAQRMFSRISGRSPVFSMSSRRQICAVVGASRNLLGSGYGPLIDAHDMVIRVNRAPTENFRSDVGSKTTHHVMWPTDRNEDQADRRAFLLMNPLTLHTEDLFDWILNLVEHDLPWDAGRVRIIHPEFVKYLHEDWTKERGYFPSTGFIALMIAVHICDDVDVFGFGADAQGRWDRYYEDRDPDEMTDLHPADFEGRLRREMEDKGILKVFLGNRSEDGVELPGFRTDASEGD